MSEQTASTTPPPKRRRRQVIRAIGLVAGLLTVLIGAAPLIVGKTGLRDRAINTILASPSVTASTDGASFGWFSPLSVDGLHLISADKRIDIRVNGVTAERSPWKLWSTAPDLGIIRAERPRVRLILPLDSEIPKPGARLEPTFTAVVTGASLTILLAGQDEPVLDVDGIDMTCRVEQADDGRVLTVDPFVVFDRRKLSTDRANRLLHLFDPTIGDLPQADGDYSLSLNKFRVPIGVPKDQAVQRMEVEGTLVLHGVSGEVKNPLRQALIHLVAEMNGKDATNVVRLARNAEVHFQVRDGRLHHEGVRIGLPDIDPGLVLTSRGSVGLDQSVDLFVELPRLDRAQWKGKAAARCRITGTVASPRIAVEDGTLALRQPGRKEPILTADGLSLSMRVENTSTGPVLVVEPVEVLKRTKVSLGVAAGLLELLAPDVHGDRQVTGEVSLALDKTRVPLGVAADQAARRLEVEGKLTLHHVVSEVKSPMWLGLIRLLADLHGKPAAGAVRLVADAEVPFHVRDGRLHHDGMRVGFPDIDPGLVVTTRGSVGFDQTVDLRAELPRPALPGQKEGRPARCHITGTFTEPKIAVEDGSLVVRQPGRQEPILAADGISLSMRVESTPDGRVLAVEPVEVFRNRKLSFAVATGLVRLLAPEVRTDREVTGEISLSLDKLRVPLGAPDEQAIKRLEAEGKLTLHQFTADVKSPTWQALTRLLADMNGKKPSDVIRVVEDSEIRFRLSGGRVYHEGQRVGFPDIDPALMATSRGSIGLDGSLDLLVELPRLTPGQRKERGPAKCHVTGTLDEPKISIPDAALVVQLTDTDKATLTVDHVNLTFGVETTEHGGRVLTLQPVTVIEKRKVTPEVGDRLLKLIAPTLSELSGVQGEVSMSFETFRVPLGVPRGDVKRVELAGKLHLHQIDVSTKTPLVETTVKLLADMYGKKPSDVVRVVENAEVRFQVRDGRMHHEGLRIGFPDISPDLVANSRGSVGFDGSLDIALEVPRLVLKKKDLPDPKVPPPPVRFKITGTIDKPVVTEIKDENAK